MTLSDLGDLGDFLGAIAVVISLIYLALQVRQNTSAVRASTYLELTNGWQHYLMSLEDRDYELAGLAVTDPERLSDAELGRLYHRVRVVFRRYENDYFQYRTGNFDSTTWAGYARSILDDAFGNPVVRAMWKLQRDNFDERFTDFMDDALAKSLARGGLPSTAKARFLEAMRESTAHPAQRE